MKKLVGIVILGIVAALSYSTAPEPKMLTVELGGGMLTFKVPEQRIVQVQLNPKPEDFGLDAAGKVDTNVIVVTQNIIVEFTAVKSEGKKISKKIVIGKYFDPSTGKQFDMKKMSGTIDSDWQIMKCQSTGENCSRETWFYANDSQAFEITVVVGDVKDKNAQAMKKRILESVVFEPGPRTSDIVPSIPSSK